MKKLLVPFLVFCTIVCNAQTIDDVGKIVIGFDIPKTSSKETLELQDYLSNKVAHWVVQSGYSASGMTSFYLTPDIAIDSEDIAEGGMKNVYVITGTLYLKIIQATDNVVFSSISLPFRNSATKRITAIKNGIGDLPFSKIVPLLDVAKEKILKYYESEKDNIFAQAELLSHQGNYDGAIACLMSIPTCLTSIYQEALLKANDILDEQVKAYNDSIMMLANSYLAQHNAYAALDVLSMYQDAKEDQNTQYKNMVTKAENLITAEEVEAAREKRQKYLDEKERQYHQWAVDEKNQDHRIDMDNQQMAYNRASLESNERLTSQRIAAGERIASQNIAANERINSERIYALKSIACSYYQNNPTSTTIVKNQF